MVLKGVARRDVLRTIGAGAALGALGAGQASAGSGTGRHIVGTETRRATRAARRRADSVHREIELGDYPTAVVGRFSREARRRLARRNDVAYVEPDHTLEILGETLPWGIDRVDAEVAHANGETGGDDGGDGGDGTDDPAGADIAVIDTGIDDDHPDLVDNLGKGKAFQGGSWDDSHGHGTHVAGTADAVDNTEGVIGISTQATLHAVRVCNGGGLCSSSDIAAGLEWTADQGYDVANVSLGGSYSQTIDNAGKYAYDNGVLLVAAAGNDGCSDCVSYPAANEEFIAVSATNSSDGIASFSSTGPAVELAAPGVDIYSTYKGGGYATFDGTSMATPHVAGAGAQLMDNGYANATQSSSDAESSTHYPSNPGGARGQLQDTAEDIGHSSDHQGEGLVDVAASLGLDSSDDLSESNSGPTVDSLDATEVETDNSDAEFDIDWAVSDPDGNLSSVDLTLTDDTDSETEDTASISVSGDTASGTDRLVAAGDDGSGNSYTVEAVVTDSDGATDSSTTSISESESTSGGTAPTVDSLSLSEDNSGGSPHADFDASWDVSDADGDLDTVDLTLYELDSNGNRVETEDSAAVDVSGGSASGSTDLKAKFDENNGQAYEVELVVTDTAGNTASATATEVEDGS